MSITYTVADYSPSDSTVEVTYTNAEGYTHTRTINIPHLEDGSIDADYLQEIFEGQLRGVENKVAVGAITFVDPNVGIGTTA
jgi:hypothetical protein